MPRLTNQNPKYCHHKGSGQAFVKIDGRILYLGKYRTKTSKAEYDRVVAEWLANGRRMPHRNGDVTIINILAAYWRHAENYYKQSDGKPSSELAGMKSALKLLKSLYGDTSAADFGPRKLETLQAEMVKQGWTRRLINQRLGRVRRVFKWAVSRELIPPSILHGLQSVSGLRKGRSDAKESEPVKPVPEAYIEAVRRFVSPVVRDMIQVQLLTGMRPGELVIMRTADIDTSGDNWVYRPSRHKNEHREQSRVVYIGPKATRILARYLSNDLQAYLFSAAASASWHRSQRAAKRRTPIGQGNSAGTNRTRRPERRPGERFSVGSYRRAIARAAERADAWAKGGRVIGNDETLIPQWHPHQLRHNAATLLRREYGLDVARAVLGHTTPAVTAIYAEIDGAKAAGAMKAIG